MSAVAYVVLAVRYALLSVGVRGIQDGGGEGGQWEFLLFCADGGGQSEDLCVSACVAVPIDDSL